MVGRALREAVGDGRGITRMGHSFVPLDEALAVVGMFDHLLAQIARHGLIDLEVSARGDADVGWHHIVEDTAIVVGRALREAVGDGRGITRMGHSFVPLDEALAVVAGPGQHRPRRRPLDFGGRGYAVVDAKLGDSDLGALPANLVQHFLETLAREGNFNLHVLMLAGANNHHKAEAVFKALARAMRTALAPDERLSGQSPSTKGTLG